MEREKLITLVTAAQNGSEAALSELFNTFYNDVYYFALKTVKDEQIALDVTQESFVEIIHTIKNLQEPAAFVKWMKKITYHQCTRYFKKKKDVIVDEDEDGNTVFDTIQEEHAEFIPDQALDQEEFRKTILAMLDELSEEQRSAVMMFYFDEFSVKQIAEIQEVSENTVKSRLNYARKGIKKSVEEYEKKNGIKLHCLGVLPILLWLFKDYFAQTVPAASVHAVAEGVSAATGVSVTAAAASAATAATAATASAGATAAIPLVTKIVAGIVAATVAIGGGTAAAIVLTQPKDPEPEKEIVSTDTERPENPEVLENVLPEGMIYTLYDGTVLKAGDSFPETCTAGDKVLYGDYYYGYECVYTNNLTGGEERIEWMYSKEIPTSADSGVKQSDILNCWLPVVADQTKTEYGPIAEEINGKPIGALWMTFYGCDKMITAPAIPETATSISVAFYGCSSLTAAPVIPASVQRMSSAFQGCSSLTGDVVIHATLDKSSFWYYFQVFCNTEKPLNLTGTTQESDLITLADEETNRKITVNGKVIDFEKRKALAQAEEMLRNFQFTTGFFESTEELKSRKGNGLRDSVYLALFWEEKGTLLNAADGSYSFHTSDLDWLCLKYFNESYDWRTLSEPAEYYDEATDSVVVQLVLGAGGGEYYRAGECKDLGNGTYEISFDIMDVPDTVLGSGVLTLKKNSETNAYYAVSCK